ncbi:outer membrane protein [Methylocystis parvus]|uniref:Porin family protein n=1 Tax=Methylocystis parvus TaxID=134 RepID=A0A6B8M5Q0_9HYPH|nr:outer membrane beta-barrel protein [Methylocystis parvus]QGM97778.1 porin family protein [Methylocystis parvus]WBK01917.1 outer membrane beta-barrel protein [Methylocystis parvus OBBP]
MPSFKKSWAIAVASFLIAPAAGAADLPSVKAPPLPPPPPAFSWQGGYVGLYAGALLGDGAFTLVNQTPLRGPAFVGGGTFGYNWRWSERIVLGAEADFGYRGFIQAAQTGWSLPSATSAGVLGTFRGRAGYLIAPQWLTYVTAGLAFGTNFISNNFTAFPPFTYGQLSSGPTLRPGWAAGAGFEYAWNDRISFKGEYLYAWLADTGVAYNSNLGVWNANVGSAGHIVRGGVNYHFAAGPLPIPVLAK